MAFSPPSKCPGAAMLAVVQLYLSHTFLCAGLIVNTQTYTASPVEIKSIYSGSDCPRDRWDQCNFYIETIVPRHRVQVRLVTDLPDRQNGLCPEKESLQVDLDAETEGFEGLIQCGIAETVHYSTSRKLLVSYYPKREASSNVYNFRIYYFSMDSLEINERTTSRPIWQTPRPTPARRPLPGGGSYPGGPMPKPNEKPGSKDQRFVLVIFLIIVMIISTFLIGFFVIARRKKISFMH